MRGLELIGRRKLWQRRRNLLRAKILQRRCFRRRWRCFAFLRLAQGRDAGEVRRIWHVEFGSLFNAYDSQNWATGAELHMRAHANFDRLSDPLAFDKSSEARITIGYQTSSFPKPELCMLARDHRPLVLWEEVMAHRRVPAHAHYFSGERVLAQQFAAAIFCQNDFHGWICESVSEARPSARAIHQGRPFLTVGLPARAGA